MLRISFCDVAVVIESCLRPDHFQVIDIHLIVKTLSILYIRKLSVNRVENANYGLFAKYISKRI